MLEETAKRADSRTSKVGETKVGEGGEDCRFSFEIWLFKPFTGITFMKTNVKNQSNNNNKNQSNNNLKLSGRKFNSWNTFRFFFMYHDKGYQEKPEKKIHNPKPNAVLMLYKSKF